VASGTAPDLSGWRPEGAQNSFADTTVDSIVLEVSHQHPQLRPGARTGVWCATKLATDAGGWRQINRAGHPMMWPIFWPDDTDFSNPANTRHPSEDVNASAKYGWLPSARTAADGSQTTVRMVTARRPEGRVCPKDPGACWRRHNSLAPCEGFRLAWALPATGRRTTSTLPTRRPDLR
jgi:hypothetical protein